MGPLDALLARLGAARSPSGRPVVVTDRDIIESYRRDRATAATAGQPLALVRARNRGDVVATLEVASEHRIPVVPRGAGTGLSGGANALDGAIVLSTAAMNAIVAIDEARRTATVEPGVLNGDLARAAMARGLWYPPDPASRDISTIGGNIATNAGGACCLKYGVTGDHVASLRAVLANGTPIATGTATRKDVAGLDLTRLLVGSEGTLAVIVEATVWLRASPGSPATLVALFATTTAAAVALSAIESVTEPSLLELMDRATIDAVERCTRMGLDGDAAALVIAQCDGPMARLGIEAAAGACSSAGATYVATTDDPIEGEQLLAARRAVLPAFERLGVPVVDDIAVPRPAIPEMIGRIEAIGQRHHLLVATYGHAGDGNLHPTIIFDPTDPDARVRGQRAFGEILQTGLALGGTLTGEHGIGSLKLPWLSRMIGSTERSLMAGIKAVFDPLGILNPGRAY